MTDGGGPTTGAGAGIARSTAFDGLRGFACLIVVLGHLWTIVPDSWLADHTGPLYGLFKSGSLGVTLFLVLGGFLVSRSLLEHQDRTGSIGVLRFWGRRLLRLGPQLYLMLGVLFLVSRVDRWDEWTIASTDRTLAAIAVFRFNLDLATGHPDAYRPDLGHMWYLSMEQQVYVLWIAALAWLGRMRLTLMALLVGGIVYCYWWRADVRDQFVESGWWRASLHTLSRADALLVGCLAALAFPFLRRFTGAARAVAGPTLAVLVVLVLFSSDLDPLAYLGGQGIAFIVVTAVLVVAVAVGGDDDIAQRILSARPLRLLGAVSFPVYLWHLPLFWAASRWASSVDWAPRAAVTLLVLAAIVVVTDRLIERPISRWLRRPHPGAQPNSDVLLPIPPTLRPGSTPETDETRPRQCQPLQSPT